MTDLQQRLHGLGLSQYHDAFVDEGFDTWDTLSDVTEADLESLDVRLGHRRRLQRAIAESRGYGPDKALPGSIRRLSLDASYNSDDSAVAAKDHSRVSIVGQGLGGSATKRKYRRHPKQDANAPERPASAYVIFSNQVREELKGKELTFTEIAKLVGERWQVLDPLVREVFERQAGTAKEKYYADLAAYKCTDDYARYQEYLADFKARHGSHTEGKRTKLESQTTNTSLSTQSSRGESLETSVDMIGSHGFSDVLRRVGSSPSAIHVHTGHIGQPLSSAPLSPAASGYSIQSPMAREPYSPVSIANSSIGHPPFDLPHHNRLHVGSDARVMDASHTGAMLGSAMAGNQSLRDPSTARVTARSRLEQLPAIPLLSHQETTLSSTGSVNSTIAPYIGSLLPVLDAPKDLRTLPTPIAGAGLGSTPYAGRPRLPPPLIEAIAVVTSDRLNADAQWPALLRATELARESDLRGPKSPPPLPGAGYLPR